MVSARQRFKNMYDYWVDNGKEFVNDYKVGDDEVMYKDVGGWISVRWSELEKFMGLVDSYKRAVQNLRVGDYVWCGKIDTHEAKITCVCRGRLGNIVSVDVFNEYGEAFKLKVDDIVIKGVRYGTLKLLHQQLLIDFILTNKAVERMREYLNLGMTEQRLK